MFPQLLQHRPFPLKSLLYQLLRLRVLGNGFELLDNASPLRGHMGIFREIGSPEPAFSEGLQNAIAIVEDIGCHNSSRCARL